VPPRLPPRRPRAEAASTSGAKPATSAAAANAARNPKPLPEEGIRVSVEEMEMSAPSNFFTGSTLITTTLIASGVAAVGLVSMFWVATYLHDSLTSMRASRDTRQGGAQVAAPKSLTQMIVERQAELREEAAELRAERRPSPEQRARLAEVRRELWHYRTGSPAWYRFW
jgi:hypothetical protein